MSFVVIKKSPTFTHLGRCDLIFALGDAIFLRLIPDPHRMSSSFKRQTFAHLRFEYKES